jgi:hypothetical protein
MGENGSVCAAKRLSRVCRRWVISLGGDRGRGSGYVRSTSDSVEILCTAAKDASAKMIGIGGSLAAPPLPHHLAYGSVPRRFEKLG